MSLSDSLLGLQYSHLSIDPRSRLHEGENGKEKDNDIENENEKHNAKENDKENDTKRI